MELKQQRQNDVVSFAFMANGWCTRVVARSLTLMFFLVVLLSSATTNPFVHSSDEFSIGVIGSVGTNNVHDSNARGASGTSTSTATSKSKQGFVDKSRLDILSGSGDDCKGQNNEKKEKHQQKQPNTLRAPRDRPNFVILFMDDLGYGDVGFGGHPTTLTPNIDKLAHEGKILTTWYSGCSVCTGSRGALMTGRQYPRIGLPGVLGPVTNVGLPLNETTVAEQLKKVGYTTAIVGKWHLGQRKAYLPANHGFDYYLGIPYSDDMGNGIRRECSANSKSTDHSTKKGNYNYQVPKTFDTTASSSPSELWPMTDYERSGFLKYRTNHFTDKTDHDVNEVNRLNDDDDPAGVHLPLVYQAYNDTQVVEQPLDFSTLAMKYDAFATNFIREHSNEPFLLYAPFSHVHVTTETQPNRQYAGCSFQNRTKRGAFGDALEEADWLIGNIYKMLEKEGVLENTLILFASDNGPNLKFGLSAGSAGLLTGRYANYWNTAKGSTWEGGIREPAFAYWKNQITPHSRSSAIVSSLDVLPTLSTLAGVPLPITDDGQPTTIDGRDMSHILLNGANGMYVDDEDVSSHHEFLFFYGTCSHGGFDRPYQITAVRHGQYKAHWCTGPGLGGDTAQNKVYEPYPLLFDIEYDPSESMPISEGEMPVEKEHAEAMERIMKAYAFEKSTFVYGELVPEPDEKDEGPSQYGVCCDRSKKCDCSSRSNESPSETMKDGEFMKSKTTPTKNTATTALQGDDANRIGLLNIGTKKHHDLYHDILGQEEPSPPVTQAQLYLRGEM